MPSNNPLEKAVNVGQLKMAYDAAALLPVDISTLTPSSIFQKHAVIGINGVLYRAKQATQQMPCTVVVDDQTGQLVTHTVNGKVSLVVDDPTPNSDWEVWSDAASEYWISLLDQRLSRFETMLAGISPDGITINGNTYTVQQLLENLAKLMGKTVVTNV